MRGRITRGKGLLVIAGLAALVAVVVLPAAGASPLRSTAGSRGSAQVARPGKRIFGVVPAGRSGHRPRRGDVAGSSFDTSANLVYHGGPVMHTNTTYAIYWVPPGYSVSPRYTTLIDRYFGDVAAASGAGSNVYASDVQYFDSVNGNILYSASSPDSFGGSYLDTSPLPASGCSDPFTTVCLTDGQVQAEIRRVVSLEGWAPSPSSLFFMFTADGIGSCTDGSSSICAFTYYCAYHSFAGSGGDELLYANIPYADTFFGFFCDAGGQPNGDDADASLNLASHEHNEAITDPLGSAWYDSSGNENGDKCAWDFGTALGSTAYGPYNQVINGHDYYLQQEWSNASGSCVLAYAQQQAAPPAVSSTSPASLPQGASNQNVTVIGSGFVDGASASFSATGITVNSTGFVDSGHLIANVTIAPDAATGPGDVTVTNPAGGGSGSCGGCFTVSAAVAAPVVQSFSPSHGKVGTLVTITGTSLTGATSVVFNQTAATSYTVASSTKITARVPTGATTGHISVTTPGGTATSAGTFKVTH